MCEDTQTLTETLWMLDHEQNIYVDVENPPIPNIHALRHDYVGLKFLADQVRMKEIEYYQPPISSSSVYWPADGCTFALEASLFNWFSVTLVNYLRLVALMGLLKEKEWGVNELGDSCNAQEIKCTCKEYVKSIIPEIVIWRNKVGAHYAATDPYNSDSLATLQLCLMDTMSLVNNRSIETAFVILKHNGTESELPRWCLTEVYERLSSRFWPNEKLSPVDINHR